MDEAGYALSHAELHVHSTQDSDTESKRIWVAPRRSCPGRRPTDAPNSAVLPCLRRRIPPCEWVAVIRRTLTWIGVERVSDRSE